MGLGGIRAYVGGGGGAGGSGIQKYASAAALPAVAADGDVAITLDTLFLYAYDANLTSWVVVGGPGVSLSANDTTSINLDITANVLTGALNIGGITSPVGAYGVSNIIGASGLFSHFNAAAISEVTSSVLQLTGGGLAVGSSLGIRVNQASGSTSGYLSSADWTTFNNKQTAGNYITGLTGPIQASGPTLALVTFQPNGVTLANLQKIQEYSLLGNNTGATANVVSLTQNQAKNIVGVSGFNFGDVTMGSIVTAPSAFGATITADQILHLTLAGIADAGVVGVGDTQVFGGGKIFNGTVEARQGVLFKELGGGSDIATITAPSNLTSGYSLSLPLAQGGTFTALQNDGLGQLGYGYLGDMNAYLAVTNAGATLSIQTKMVEVTTGATNRTINIGWAAAGNTGVVTTVMKVDSGVGSVTVQSPDLINGATNFTWSSQWESHKFISNGVNFRVLDDQAEVVAAKYTLSGATYLLPSAIPQGMQFNQQIFDTHSAATYGAGVTFTFVAPVAGYYSGRVGAHTNSVAWTSSTALQIVTYVNGTTAAGGFTTDRFDANVTRVASMNHPFLVNLAKNDLLTFQILSSGVTSFTSGLNFFNVVEILQESGPPQSQSLSAAKASYQTNAGQSINNASLAIVDFEDQLFDTSGAVTTGAAWKFTAPRTGTLDVAAKVEFGSASFSANANMNMYVYKNNSIYKKIANVLIQSAITDTISLSGTCMVNVTAGDFIDIRVEHGEGSARSLSSTVTDNYCDISYTDGVS